MITKRYSLLPFLLLIVALPILFFKKKKKKEDPGELATLTTSAVTQITSSSAQSGGDITDDGRAGVTVRGVCWNTSPNPTVYNLKTTDGSGTGSFTSYLTDLSPNTTYYLRAYSTNSIGTSYGDEVEFKAQDTDTYTEVVEVTNPATGKTWMDRNLGASRAANSSTDIEAYGDLYQWGRATDGHQLKTSGTTTNLSNSDTPGHDDFFLLSDSPWDWRSPQNDNLWQDVNGTNNPCPEGFRLPTGGELDAERGSWSSNTSAGAYASALKLPVAGYRRIDGSLHHVGFKGFYWTATVHGASSVYLGLESYDGGIGYYHRALGYSVRCIKESL